jgi:hypothetical protein
MALMAVILLAAVVMEATAGIVVQAMVVLVATVDMEARVEVMGAMEEIVNEEKKFLHSFRINILHDGFSHNLTSCICWQWR